MNNKVGQEKSERIGRRNFGWLKAILVYLQASQLLFNQQYKNSNSRHHPRCYCYWHRHENIVLLSLKIRVTSLNHIVYGRNLIDCMALPITITTKMKAIDEFYNVNNLHFIDINYKVRINTVRLDLCTMQRSGISVDYMIYKVLNIETVRTCIIK